MTRNYILALTLVPMAFVAACATTPEPIIEEPPVVVELPPVQTCVPIAQLEKVVVPAVVKRGMRSTSVENPPEYVTDPETGEVREVIQNNESAMVPFEVIIKPEEIYYVNSEGLVVEDICDDEPELAAP